jgi:uncharacterized phage protein (TIGR01671 family)
MEYRVYNIKEKRWVGDNVYLTPDGELYTINKSVLGRTKLSELSRDRYEYHRAIDLRDKNGIQIYEGDYIQAQVDENKSVIGMVAFAFEFAAYVILCDDLNQYFTLGSEVTDLIQVIGNVFDGYEVVQDGEQSLQETKV